LQKQKLFLNTFSWEKAGADELSGFLNGKAIEFINILSHQSIPFLFLAIHETMTIDFYLLP